ncbi:enoyl-CoA hydratase-related protein [Rhizobium alvei]|uniref:Enoyl-CoA hydratase-related protein n=1 Tax=Rhizobium alvei TaxID=1132659 RepID=A0ABT8YK53_9HYPH|nr:enoyl-CoA hydratase-related protein [Rhizobium alvei]MDO6964023.1 enoyl-CoA hydratase-related protein [Rhizobium alvei]
MFERTYAENRLRTRLEGLTGHIVMANPGRKNAVDQAMWASFPEAIDALTQAGARAIVLAGEGTDFSAGADISEFDRVRRDTETALAYEALNSAAFRAVRQSPVPVIAAIAGICFGGGFGLAAAADIRIAEAGASFAVPAARLGLAYPADAIGDIVDALGTQWTKIALYTARRFSASELYDHGFLAEVTAVGGATSRAMDLAQTIAANAPLSIRASSLAIQAAINGDPTSFDAAVAAGAVTFDSADYAEGRKAFAEKRSPQFTGR